MRAITILLLLTGILLGAGAGYFGHEWLSTPATASRTAPTPSSDSSDTVVARGRLEPGSELIAVGLPPGSRVERLLVTEDQPVQEGDSLAYLDSHDELAAAEKSAAVQLAEARKQFEVEVALGKANVEAARLRIRQVEEVLPLTIRAQEAEIRRSRAELEKARLDRRRAQQMLDDKAIPQSQLDAASLLEQQAQEQLRRNEATLRQLQCDRDIKQQLARADLKSAEAGAARAQLATQVEALAEAMKVAHARLGRTIISAPVAGKILEILTHVGEAAGNNPLLKMGDTRTMYAVAEVYETDVWRVHKGQRATLTSSAFPPNTKPLEGTVERISQLVHKNHILGIDPAAEADARIIEVRIRLDDSSPAAGYNQLQVDVAIHVGKDADAGRATPSPPASP